MLFLLFQNFKTSAINNSIASGDTAMSRRFFESGIKKFSNRQYKEALIDFEKTIEHDAENWKAYQYKAHTEYNMGKYKEAIPDYNKALYFNKNDTASYKGIADAYSMVGDYKNAIEYYNTVIKMDSNDYMMYYGRGYSYYSTKQYEKSISDYNKAITDKNAFPLFYYNRSMSYLELHKYREVVNDINKYLNLGKGEDKHYAYIFRGEAYYNLSIRDSALIDFTQHAKLFPKDPIVYRFLGMTHALKGDTTLSRQYFNQSIILNPNDAITYMRWGSVELEVFHDPKKAQKLLTMAANKSSGAAKYIRTNIYYFLGCAQMNLKDTTGAFNSFNMAILVDSNNYDAYDMRVALLMGNTNYNALLVKDLSTLIRIYENMDNLDTVTLGYFYYVRSAVNFRSSNTTEGLKDIDKAIEISPNQPSYYLMRATFNYLLRHNRDFIFKDLNKAINLDNKYLEAYLTKAAVYSSLEDRTNGCLTLKKAAKLGGIVSQEVEDYICKGKKPDSGVVPDIGISILPKMSDNSKLVKKKKRGVIPR